MNFTIIRQILSIIYRLLQQRQTLNLRLLNHEHIASRWVTHQEIELYILWPEQQRLMNLLASIEINNKILEEWIIN